MSSSTERQEERIRLGLIAYLTEHTVDPDYAAVRSRRNARAAARGTTRGTSGRRSGRSRIAAVVVLALFGLLIFTAASQTSRGSSASAAERSDLINQVDGRRSSLDARNATLKALTLTNERLRTELRNGSTGSLTTTVRGLRVSTGSEAVTGPGVTMVADDKIDADSDRERVLDKDLQRLVNGLWAAGAEAISVNGQRISNLTSIRDAGGRINVNYVPLQAPYTVRAIGDPDTLASRFADSTSGTSWFDLVQQVGLRLQISTSQGLEVPASDQLDLRYAQRVKGGPS